MNARYIMEALGKFMKIFRKKRPVMAARDWMFLCTIPPPCPIGQ